MNFTKMHGAGNDFIIINNMEEKIEIEKFSQIAKKLCERRMSIGADGLMVVDSSDLGVDFKMTFFNADGSIGEMCGNGARCIARYGYEKGLSGEIQIIETDSGIIKGWRKSETEYRIMLNPPTLIKLDHNISIEDEEYECSYVELGDPGLPHAVVKIENMDNILEEEFWKIGNKLRYHESFSKGANINFYEIKDGDIFVRTFERGVEDFTLACGTGSGSVALVLKMLNEVEDDIVSMNFPGGVLDVEIIFNQDDSKEIYLTGPTNIIIEGKVTDAKLEY